jgi:hypothetical protein
VSGVAQGLLRRKAAGRHRARAAAPTLAPPVAMQAEPARVVTPTAGANVSVQASASSSGREELAHTLRVGAVSAAIVLALFVSVLLGLAAWLP